MEEYIISSIKTDIQGAAWHLQDAVKEAALPFPKDIPMHDIWIGNVAAFTI